MPGPAGRWRARSGSRAETHSRGEILGQAWRRGTHKSAASLFSFPLRGVLAHCREPLRTPGLLHCRPMTYGALASSILLAESKFEAAITQATAEIAATPDDPEAHFNRGQALAALGRFAEAATDYERALGLDASASGLDPEAAD